MLGKYFYNKNIRNIVILFGTIFNDITIKRVNSNGTIQNTLKVPIAYGPAQKYLTRLEQGNIVGDIEALGMVLPRMSFEITSMTYDPTRKLQTTKKIRETKILGSLDSIDIVDGGSGYTLDPVIEIQAPSTGTTATAIITPADEENNIPSGLQNGVVTSITLTDVGSGYTSVPNVTIKKNENEPTDSSIFPAELKANVNADTKILTTAYTPVPYNFDIDLSIMVVNSDDGAQILEQILPFFTPELHVTLNEMKLLGVKRDIPVVYNSMTTEDDYEGDFLTRRSLTHTLSFTVQGYLYGPLKEQGIIREVDVNAGTSFQLEDTKNLNINIVPNPTDADPDDIPKNTTTTVTDL
tara:strand:- start:473 stop:1528 length:1056 start_codon:yes stop_codon:yes gene_type:complete